jgi:hypothetical protein
VAISADGNTAIVAGVGDTEGLGEGSNGADAAWVYARSGGVWIQQGPKLNRYRDRWSGSPGVVGCAFGRGQYGSLIISAIAIGVAWPLSSVLCRGLKDLPNRSFDPTNPKR